MLAAVVCVLLTYPSADAAAVLSTLESPAVVAPAVIVAPAAVVAPDVVVAPAAVVAPAVVVAPAAVVAPAVVVAPAAVVAPAVVVAPATVVTPAATATASLGPVSMGKVQRAVCSDGVVAEGEAAVLLKLKENMLGEVVRRTWRVGWSTPDIWRGRGLPQGY